MWISKFGIFNLLYLASNRLYKLVVQ